MFYKHFIQPLLFRLDAESTHNFVFNVLRFASLLTNRFNWLPDQNSKKDSVNLLGLNFPNKLGLAAGFDKNGLLLDYWKYIGFGFVEVGTITPKPQVGNPKPRLFRLPADDAILNRMGFNNDGAMVIRKRLEQKPANLVVGVNIGKNKDTPNADAARDYCNCVRELSSVADYFVVNVSSPNTPALRDLQAKEPLYRLLSSVQEENYHLNSRPVLLKISPDLTESDIQDVLEVSHNVLLAGFVVCNTTISRSNLATDANMLQKIGAGGISGKPLTSVSSEMLSKIRQQTNLVVISVGGISSKQEAANRIQTGADLIQIYTSLVYHGPRLVKVISHSL